MSSRGFNGFNQDSFGIDRVADDGPSVEELVEQRLLHEALIVAINQLPLEQRVVIWHRYGFVTGEEMSYRDVSEQTGVSLSRMLDLEVQGINNLRSMFGRSPSHQDPDALQARLFFVGWVL